MNFYRQVYELAKQMPLYKIVLEEKTFTDIRDDILAIKNYYVHLLDRMNDEMQKVNPSEKYEKAIVVPLVEEYLSGNAIEMPREEDMARAYTKLSTGAKEIYERRIFNRLLSFIYLDFCKARTVLPC